MRLISPILIVLITLSSAIYADEHADQPGNPLDKMIDGDDAANSADPVRPAVDDWTSQGFILPPPPPTGGVYDDTLPNDPTELEVKPYEGDRYTREIPDTLDLAQYADRSINFLTQLISPEETDYCVYHFVHLDANPAVLEVGHMSTLAQNAKWSEGIVLMRSMSGNNDHLEQDKKLIGSLVRITGRDGLCYHPVAGRPWAYIDPITKENNVPYSDIFCEGRQLRAYALWYAHDGNELWKQLADRKTERLMALSWQEDGKRYFRRSRGFSPEYIETGQGDIVALGDAGGVYEGMTGDAAANIVCWPVHALTTWHYLTGSQDAKKLADGLAQYLYEDQEFYDEQHRGFPSIEHGHPTIFSHTMDGMCSYALTTGNQGMINWVIQGYEQWHDLRDPDRIGIAQSVEACQIADMIQVGCMLSRAGVADYWENVDKMIRNSVAAMQIDEWEVERLKNQPRTVAGDPDTEKAIKCYAWGIGGDIPLNRPLPPFLHQPEDATDRTLGAWYVAVNHRGVSGSIGCCNGNMCRGLYMAWDSILEHKNDALWVNLHLNRASRWADIDSYLPHEGKLVIELKEQLENLYVRIPAWTDWNLVQCTVNGEQRNYGWVEDRRGYINLGPVEPEDVVTIEYPMKQWVVKTDVVVRSVIDPSEVIRCDVTLCGNAIVDISEEVGYPKRFLDRNSREHVETKQTQRFVPDEEYFWFSTSGSID